jgi:DNA-binding response OmpR family regulator
VLTVARMTEVLLAEPEATMRGFLERQLRSDGFDVLAFPSTDELPRAADPDLLVLGNPDELDRCRVPDCPVIVLGRPDPDTKVRALERCDDYLARPFVYEELVARIRALLRRCPPRSEVLDLGELVVDRRARRVLARGREVDVSQKEYALLVKLATDPDRVFTREHLLRDVWGYPGVSATRTVESHASRLRVKLGAAGLDGWVVNAWGVGYKLRPASAA